MLRVVALGSIVVLVGCTNSVTLTISGDRPVPTAVDAICVGVADTTLGGVQFGQRYLLEGDLAGLPQTLRIDPGAATTAWAWVRGDRGGVPVARAGTTVDFAHDVALSLDRCEKGGSGAPAQRGDPLGPADARLVVSNGVGGELVVALGAGAVAIDADGDLPVSGPVPDLPAGAIRDAIAVDIDGDCDDDIVIATDGAPPAIWLRDGQTFVFATSLGDTAADAVAAADVDRDGDIDLVTGAGGALALWRNDGGGGFAQDPAALSANGRLASVRALAFGDLDDDGNPDLVVGQGGDPLRAWLGEPGGTGSFLAADAVISPIPLDVARMQLADLDDDFDPDLLVAVNGGPVHLYIDREGLLEDQTFVRFVDTIPEASAIATGGWDPNCEADALFATAAGTESRRGTGGSFEVDASMVGATDVVMVDLDDDGKLDAVLATPEGVRWFAR